MKSASASLALLSAHLGLVIINSIDVSLNHLLSPNLQVKYFYIYLFEGVGQVHTKGQPVGGSSSLPLCGS